MRSYHYVAAVLAMLTPPMISVQALATAHSTDPLIIQDCDFGEVYAFSPSGCSFTVENTAAKALNLSIVPVQPGNTVEPSKLALAPGSRAQIEARVQTDNIAGEIAWTFRIEGAGIQPHFARAGGFVMSILDDPHPRIAFGTVDAKGGLSKSIELVSSIAPRLRITRVLSSPRFLHAKVGDDARTLVAEIGSDVPWGPFDETVKLAIESPQQYQVWVEVVGSVDGDIGPEKNPYWFGTVLSTPQETLTVPLIDRTGGDFSIGNVTASNFHATYGSADCSPARRGCKVLLIHVAREQPAGFFKSELNVALPDRKKHLTVGIWGILEVPALPGQKSTVPGLTRLELPKPEPDDVTLTPPLKVQPEPAGDGPLLKWTVEHQEGLYGYLIFRSYVPSGPFAVMDAHILPVLDNGKGAVTYQWRDTSATKGRTYWYYISTVAKDGSKKALSKPLKAIAK